MASTTRRGLMSAATNSDAELLALCVECCRLEEESHVLFRKVQDANSKEQMANEEICERLDRQSGEIFDRIRVMKPSTLAGQQAVARVALWYVGREVDETTIETNYTGEGLAWMLVRQIAGGDRWAELSGKPSLAGEAA